MKNRFFTLLTRVGVSVLFQEEQKMYQSLPLFNIFRDYSICTYAAHPLKEASWNILWLRTLRNIS